MDQSISFKLQTFEGPLDLLMHLIKRNKVSIIDIPIVEITEQYMAYLAQMEDFEIEVSSEFLVMAAQLLYIKSRMLLPRQEETAEEEGDPREELVKRLMEYQRYKEASGYLKEREFASRYCFFKGPEAVERAAPDYSGQSYELDALMRAFAVVLEKTERKEPPPKTSFQGIVGREKVSISSRVRYLRTVLAAGKPTAFGNIFRGISSRPAVIATFLALLELVKLERIEVEEHGNEVYVTRMGEIDDELTNEPAEGDAG